MDIYSFWSFCRDKLRLEKRAESLSKGYLREIRNSISKTYRRYQRLWVAALFLVLSLALGDRANEMSQKTGASSWEKSHPPSQKVIFYSLKSRGLTLIQGVSFFQKIYRTIPTSLDEEGSIWLSEDANWVAFFLASAEAIPAQIYCLICKQLPVRWEPLGRGWQAFEKSLEELDHKIAALKLSRPKKFLPRDSREIVY